MKGKVENHEIGGICLSDEFQFKKKKKKTHEGVPLRRSGLRIPLCHCYSLGHCCGASLIPGPRTLTCCGQSKKEKKKKKKQAKVTLGTTPVPGNQQERNSSGIPRGVLG